MSLSFPNKDSRDVGPKDLGHFTYKSAHGKSLSRAGGFTSQILRHRKVSSQIQVSHVLVYSL